MTKMLRLNILRQYGLCSCLFVLLAMMSACHGNNMNYPVTPQPEAETEHQGKPVRDTLPPPSVPTVADVSAPLGVFVSSGPTVSDRVLAQNHVAGNLIRVGWDQVQPTPTTFDFSAIDALLEQAQQHQKQVTLSVLNGPRAPQWLYEKGAQSFNYEFKNRYSERGNRQEMIPLPWDKTYLQYWSALIEKLGQRYAGNSTIALVHITHASKNGFEMQLPEERIGRQPETASRGPWHDAGYTTEQHVAALQQVIDDFARAFPQTPIDIEIHPVLDSVEVPRRIYEYGSARYGKRFGLFSAWWSGKSQRWNEALYPLLQRACDNAFCNIQLIGNQSKQPERLLDSSLLSAMTAAKKMGARYFEVWSADLANRALEEDIAAFSRTLKQDK